MNIVRTFTARNDRIEVTTIAVWKTAQGYYVPDSIELGMGHSYHTALGAAQDLARRHGYTLCEVDHE